MKRQIRSLVAGSLLATAAINSALAQTSGEGAPNMASQGGITVDQAVHKFLKDNALPGATVAVTRKGRLVWSKGYGYSDAEAKAQMQPWHRTRIGSVSKFFTALGAMKLVESGALSLTARVYGDSGPFVSLNAPWPGEAAAFGVLNDSASYWPKMLEGVQNLNPANAVNSEMNKTIDWAKEIRVKHLLSHTAGFIRSGEGKGAAKYWGKDEDDLTYPELHKYMLTGGAGAPFEFAPESKWQYSNHGFGLAGHIISERAGMPYRDFVEQQILHPLGLVNVVPNNTSIGNLDAKPKGYTLDPSDPSRLGMATGGWSATARDLVRVMCSIDRTHNNTHRLLKPDTVKLMESDPVPSQAGRPIGWDSRSGTKLSKDGRIGGGTALIHKYLPGGLSEDEINIAIAISSWSPVPFDLIQTIAEAAAKAYIPDDYDLFEPGKRCYESGPKRFHVSEVTLIGFYPANTSNPLPAKIEGHCPADITLVGTLKHIGKGKVDYRFRFPVENRVTTTFTTTITGDPEDPLYSAPQVKHTFPFPPAFAAGGGGGAGPGIGFEAAGAPKQKGPGQFATETVTNRKGMVRLEILKPTGGVVSNDVHYHLECEPKLEILSGKVDLRDDRSPVCPRPASVGASIRVNKDGPVPYVLDCGDASRTWKGTMNAQKTGPNTFIGVAVHPLQIVKNETIECVLREPGKLPRHGTIAKDEHDYSCRPGGVTTGNPVPPPPGAPSGLAQPKQPAPPRLVCIGGKTGSSAAAPCVCPQGQVAKQTGANRFKCETQLACEGGRVVMQGRPPEPACWCPQGMRAEPVVRPVAPAKRLVALKDARDDDDVERYRCVRAVTSPPAKTAIPQRGGAVQRIVR